MIHLNIMFEQLYLIQILLMTKKIEGLKDIIAKYKNFFFDLDGVIWKGSEKIQGGIEALKYLRQSNKRIFFITNSSIRNKQMLKDRFLQFGFEAQLDQIFPSDYITRLYICSKYPQLKKLLVIGAPSLVNQIKKSGKQVAYINDIHVQGIIDPNSIQKHIDPTIDGVVMGYDNGLTYNKIVLTTLYVQLGAKFIGTNPDKYTMIKNLKIPGCGSMIKCIQQATSIKAEIAGKPNPFIIDYLIKELSLNQSQCLMIGDNLQTDIAFGKNGGIDSLCVLTGVSTQKMVLQSNTATYYAEYL